VTTNTTVNGWPLPSMTDQPVITSAVNSPLVLVDRRVNPVFATTTARDVAITAPDEGMECYVTATKEKYIYNGTRWIGAAWRTHNIETTQVINNTVTPQNITEGAISLEANSVYEIHYELEIQSYNGAGFRWQFNTPALTTGHYRMHMYQEQVLEAQNFYSDSWGADAVPGPAGGLGIERGYPTGDAVERYVLFKGTIQTAANAGTLQLKMAQQTAIVQNLKIFGFSEGSGSNAGCSIWRSLKIR